MTTLEQLAKLAYEGMLAKYAARNIFCPPQWEREAQQVRDDWIAAIRAAVEGMREPPSPRTPMGKTAMRATPMDFWQAVIDTILEEKP